MHSQSAGLERRVQHLERLVRALGVLVAALAGLMLIAARPAAQSEELVRARRVQLVDDAGQVRMELRHDSTETGLFILDVAGDTRVGVAQFAHGGGGFALHGPQMRGAAVLYLKGAGSLSIYDSTGTVSARFPAAPR